MFTSNKDLIFIIIISILLVFNIYQYYVSKISSSKEILKNKYNDDFLKDNILTIDTEILSDTNIREIYLTCLDLRIPLKIKNGINFFTKIKEKWNVDYLKKKLSLDKQLYNIIGTPLSEYKYKLNEYTYISNNSEYISTYIESYKKKFKIIDNISDLVKINKENIINKKNGILIDAMSHMYLDKNYIEYTKDNPTTNMFRRETSIFNNNIRIKDDIIPNILFNENNIRSFIIYNGPKNTGILPHSHQDSLNILKYGKKKWIFISDRDILKNSINDYYKLRKNTKNIRISWMNWYKNYIKIQKKYDIECIQESGDIIVVPDKIFHTVYNIEDSLGTVIDIKPELAPPSEYIRN